MKSECDRPTDEVSSGVIWVLLIWKVW